MNVLAQAPCRIGLFGSGTDTEPFASEYGGVAINMAINIRQQIILGGENKLLDGDNPDFFKTFTDSSVEHIFDGGMRGGLGSSAALAVALLGAIYKYKDIKIPRDLLAHEAWNIEVNKLGLFGGKQDQYASVFGGMNTFKFEDKVTRNPFPRSIADELKEWILLFDTGVRRQSPKIQENLKKLSDKQLHALQTIKELTNEAYHHIYTRNFKKIGNLLDLSWRSKKKSNPEMTTPEIEAIYERAITLGAVGGKLCGSGGGGFMIFMVEPSIQKAFVQKLGLRNCDFSICYNGLETRILYKYDRERGRS